MRFLLAPSFFDSFGNLGVKWYKSICYAPRRVHIWKRMAFRIVDVEWHGGVVQSRLLAMQRIRKKGNVFQKLNHGRRLGSPVGVACPMVPTICNEFHTYKYGRSP